MKKPGIIRYDGDILNPPPLLTIDTPNPNLH